MTKEQFCKENGHSIFVNVSGISVYTAIECARCGQELKTYDLRNDGAFVAISENGHKTYNGKSISPHCQKCIDNEKFITETDRVMVDLTNTSYSDMYEAAHARAIELLPKLQAL